MTAGIGRKTRQLLLWLPAVLLAGCGSSLVWTGNYSFPGNTWHPEHTVTFVPDTISLEKNDDNPLTGVLSIRYAAKMPMEMLPLVMEIESPQDGLYRCDTIQQRLLPMDERTAGKGTLGVFESCDTILLHSRPVPGWSVSFYPASEEDISGIFSITFELLK